MQLEVQICTFGAEGMARVGRMTLPLLEGVLYTAVVQNPGGEELPRVHAELGNRFRVLEHASRGLSINRNYGLDHAVGDILLIADDDLRYTPAGLEAVVKAFEDHPEIDFATFCHLVNGQNRSKFPDHEFVITEKLPKGYFITSFEIALRRTSLPARLRFSPNLGIGAPYYGAAEEMVFMWRLSRAGLAGRFFPVIITDHLGLPSGERRATPAFLRAQGAWFWIRYGWLEGMARLLRDVPRRNSSAFDALRHMIAGFFHAPGVFNQDGSDK